MVNFQKKSEKDLLQTNAAAADVLLSQVIGFLRFPLTVGVAFIHFYLSITGLQIHGITYCADPPAWFVHMNDLFSGVLTGVCVPMFFFFSGFLFFYGKDFTPAVFVRKLKTRFRTLLVPYILWNVVAIVYTAKVFIPFLSFLFTNAGSIGLNLTVEGLLRTFYDNGNGGLFTLPGPQSANAPMPINGPLWYIRDLMLVVLCAPLWYLLVKRLKGWFVAVLGTLFVYSPFMAVNSYASQLLMGVFFFSWGALFSIGGLDFVAVFRRYRFLPAVYLCWVVADVAAWHTAYGMYIHKAGVLIGIPAVVSMAAWLLQTGRVRVCPTLAGSSFFVFALHTLVMRDLAKVVLVVFRLPDTPAVMTMLYFVIPVTTVLLCVGCYVLLKRYAPPVCALLTGGR